jgi:hypothetical protein
MEILQKALEIFFPKETFKWFILDSTEEDENNIYITLKEKNIPPISKDLKGKVKFVKFRNITITDFPLRGKRTLLTFRRRYWKIEGQSKYLKRDIKLSFSGTKLNEEFANFLKESSGKQGFPAEFYSRVSLPSSERI